MNTHRMPIGRLLCIFLCWGGVTAIASKADTFPSLDVWPTIPFVRGQDLCQYQDAYGKTRAQQSQGMARLLGDLLRSGADPQQSTQLLQTVDTLIEQGRQRATSGFVMDVLLEGSFKAALDRAYDTHHPKVRKVNFVNPSALNDLVRALRTQQRQGHLEGDLLKSISAVAWGTYSYSPGCKGDVLVTLHIETHSGRTFNYQARGLPESVMGQIGNQVFTQFQKTQFPSRVTHLGKPLDLLGGPGMLVGTTSSPRKAEYACQCMQARLPTVGEYIYLSELGHWNGGVDSSKGLWALAKEKIMAPEMPRPSIVRSVDEFQSPEIRYFCVRSPGDKPPASQCAP